MRIVRKANELLSQVRAEFLFNNTQGGVNNVRQYACREADKGFAV